MQRPATQSCVAGSHCGPAWQTPPWQVSVLDIVQGTPALQAVLSG
jgi:hypothetical protein